MGIASWCKPIAAENDDVPLSYNIDGVDQKNEELPFGGGQPKSTVDPRKKLDEISPRLRSGWLSANVEARVERFNATMTKLMKRLENHPKQK